MLLLHVFEEDDQDRMQGHLENWFGYPEAGGHEYPAVCFCGACVFVLKKDFKDASNSVGIVWHTGVWRHDGQGL